MSAQDYIYCYQGKALRVAGGTAVVGLKYDPYSPVTIGSQTWMSKNLAIDDGQGGIYTQTVNYGQGDVVEYYYTWAAAVRVASSIEGWHLPTVDEFGALANAVGGSSTAGTKLKSTYGWSAGNGTDDYGFSAFPAGYRSPSSFSDMGSYARFWTANELTSTYAYSWYFSTGAAMNLFNYNKTYAYSVRLIKDSE